MLTKRRGGCSLARGPRKQVCQRSRSRAQGRSSLGSRLRGLVRRTLGTTRLRNKLAKRTTAKTGDSKPPVEGTETNLQHADCRGVHAVAVHTGDVMCSGGHETPCRDADSPMFWSAGEEDMEVGVSLGSGRAHNHLFDRHRHYAPVPDSRLPCGLLHSQVDELLSREITPEDYEMLLLLDETLVRPTASLEALESLSSVRAGTEFVDGSCGVCLAGFEADDFVTTLGCKHTFHHSCILKWLGERKRQCPLCGVEAVAV